MAAFSPVVAYRGQKPKLNANYVFMGDAMKNYHTRWRRSGRLQGDPSMRHVCAGRIFVAIIAVSAIVAFTFYLSAALPIPLPNVATRAVLAPRLRRQLSAQASVSRRRNAAPRREALSVRIFVYELSEVVGDVWAQLEAATTAKGATCDFRERDCGLHQFMHERVLVDHLRASPHVTTDPAAADLFLVPFPSTLFYMLRRDIGRLRRCLPCEEVEERIEHLIRHSVVGKARWQRRHGHDHVFFSLRCPHEANVDLTNRGFKHVFNTFEPTVRGVHICLEPPRAIYLRDVESSWRFHAIVVPALVDTPLLLDDAYEERTAQKSTLLFFQGATHNSKVREPVTAAMASAGDCKVVTQHGRFHFLQPEEHARLMGQSTFCYCPRGDTAISKRMYDAVAARCIPVVVADDAEWAFETRAPRAHFSVHVQEDAVLERPKDGGPSASGAERLIDMLRALPAERVRALQRALETNWRRYRYGPSYVPGEVLDSVVEELGDRLAVLREVEREAAASGEGADGQPSRLSAEEWARRLRERFDAQFAQAPPNWEPI